MLVKPLATLGKKYDIKFIVVGANKAYNKVPQIDNVKVIVKDWNLQTEWREIENFDIGVMPLFDGLWERGKCAFKAIQYMTLGIPAVCSAVGEAIYLIKDGKNGFLCNTEEDWISKLEELICSRNLREKIGKEGRKTIVKDYNIEKIAKRVYDILEDLFTN